MNRDRLFEEVILKSWWAILFFLLCFFAFDQAMRRRNTEEEKLQSQFEGLKQDRKEALALAEELQRQIGSQNDREWIEMTLMRCLGLVPEGQIKVHFSGTTH